MFPMRVFSFYRTKWDRGECADEQRKASEQWVENWEEAEALWKLEPTQTLSAASLSTSHTHTAHLQALWRDPDTEPTKCRSVTDWTKCICCVTLVLVISWFLRDSRERLGIAPVCVGCSCVGCLCSCLSNRSVPPATKIFSWSYKKISGNLSRWVIQALKSQAR